MTDGRRVDVRVLVEGTGEGRALVLPEPLSLWGGLEPTTGEITDRRHPRSGEIVTGRVLVLPCGRGSSSASSILLEAVRLGTAPAAIILAEVDPILALGTIVARELYETAPPVVVAPPDAYASIVEGMVVRVDGASMVAPFFGNSPGLG